MKYNQWWTIREMAELKGIPYKTLRLPQYRDILPPVAKIGGVLKAHIKDVLSWRDMSDAEVRETWHSENWGEA